MTRQSSLKPCGHSAWLEIDHVLVPSAYTTASSSAQRQLVRRRKTTKSRLAEIAVIKAAEMRSMATMMTRARTSSYATLFAASHHAGMM
jgi:hypothetical protein